MGYTFLDLKKCFLRKEVKVASTFLNGTVYFWYRRIVADVETNSTAYYAVTMLLVLKIKTDKSWKLLRNETYAKMYRLDVLRAINGVYRGVLNETEKKLKYIRLILQ